MISEKQTASSSIARDFTKATISWCLVVPLLGIREAIALADIDNPDNWLWKSLQKFTRYGQGKASPAATSSVMEGKP